MAVAYYGSHISEHLVKTPEGYLICYDVPINRTGTQMYTAGEAGRRTGAASDRLPPGGGRVLSGGAG